MLRKSRITYLVIVTIWCILGVSSQDPEDEAEGSGQQSHGTVTPASVPASPRSPPSPPGQEEEVKRDEDGRIIPPNDYSSYEGMEDFRLTETKVHRSINYLFFLRHDHDTNKTEMICTDAKLRPIPNDPMEPEIQKIREIDRSGNSNWEYAVTGHGMKSDRTKCPDSALLEYMHGIGSLRGVSYKEYHKML